MPSSQAFLFKFCPSPACLKVHSFYAYLFIPEISSAGAGDKSILQSRHCLPMLY